MTNDTAHDHVDSTIQKIQLAIKATPTQVWAALTATPQAAAT